MTPHHLGTIVVNGIHLWWCQRCGKRWTPDMVAAARRETCTGPEEGE